MSGGADLTLAVLAWEAGRRRLEGPPSADEATWRVVEAVEGELRRRVGKTFRMADLAEAYAGSRSLFLALAADVAPRSPDAWRVDVGLDGAFGRYGRQAVDWGAV